MPYTARLPDKRKPVLMSERKPLTRTKMQNSERINEQTQMLSKEQIAGYDNGQLGNNSKHLPHAENVEAFSELLTQYDKMAVYAAMYVADGCADQAESILSEGYGCYSDVIKWAETSVNDCYDLKEPLSTYFDYEQWAYDVLLGGDMVAVDTPDGVYMFNGHV